VTVVVVLDPSIALGVADENGLERLQDWVTDHRVRLGHQAWTRLANGYGEQSLGTPKALAQIAHRVIGDLLTREPLLHDVALSTATLHPEYLGSADHRQILVDDLSGMSTDAASVLGTDAALWEGDASVVRCDPPPPARLSSHLEPNLPTPEDLRAEAAAWFLERRILIVGGQVDSAVVAALDAMLGIDEARVQWIPSEKNKRARNLKKVIGGLPATAVVVCIVGKVGHDVSGEVKDNCSRRGLVLVDSRFASQIADDLRALVD
jgi:hypothetical protein